MDQADQERKALEARFAARLQTEAAELTQLSRSTAADRAPVELDQQSVGRLSRMDAIQGQAMAQAADRRRQLRQARIKAALKRIEEGEFGYCTVCGEPIGENRLEADPTIPTCIACASKASG